MASATARIPLNGITRCNGAVPHLRHPKAPAWQPLRDLDGLVEQVAG